MTTTYVNIQNSAPNFTEPLPFQHFTGDYATASTSGVTQPSGVTSANQCDAVCKNEPACEFFKFTTPSGPCQLFSAPGTNVVSGIKIDKSLRGIGQSNIYSVGIPGTSPISSPTPATDSNQCETRCNSDPNCRVYGYDVSTTVCTMYGTPLASGNVGSSRDVRDVVATPTPTFTFTPSGSTLANFGGTQLSYIFIANQSQNTYRIYFYDTQYSPIYTQQVISIGTYIRFKCLPGTPIGKIITSSYEYFQVSFVDITNDTIIPIPNGISLNTFIACSPSSIETGTRTTTTPSKTLAVTSATQYLNTIVFKGTSTGTTGTETVNVLYNESVIGSGTVSDFTSASGMSIPASNGGTFTLQFPDGTGSVTSPSVTFSTPTLSVQFVQIQSSDAKTLSLTNPAYNLPGYTGNIDVYVNGSSSKSISQSEFYYGDSFSDVILPSPLPIGANTVEFRVGSVTTGTQTITVFSNTTPSVTAVSPSGFTVTTDVTGFADTDIVYLYLYTNDLYTELSRSTSTVLGLRNGFAFVSTTSLTINSSYYILLYFDTSKGASGLSIPFTYTQTFGAVTPSISYSRSTSIRISFDASSTIANGDPITVSTSPNIGTISTTYANPLTITTSAMSPGTPYTVTLSSTVTSETPQISFTFNYPSGGTVTTLGSDRIHTFTTNGTLTIPANFSTGSMIYLLVGGGGSGSTDAVAGNGGGGGQVLTGTLSSSWFGRGNMNVVVGAGGAGSNSSSKNGNPGFQSIISLQSDSTTRLSASGGSPGGTTSTSQVVVDLVGTKTTRVTLNAGRGGAGNAGVNQSSPNSGSAICGNSGNNRFFNAGGTGGSGVTSDISSSTNTIYGCGGGGAVSYTYTLSSGCGANNGPSNPIRGGSQQIGDGNTIQDSGGFYNSATMSAASNGSAPPTNSGSGSGGSANNLDTQSGANGIVIIRYPA